MSLCQLRPAQTRGGFECGCSVLGLHHAFLLYPSSLVKIATHSGSNFKFLFFAFPPPRAEAALLHPASGAPYGLALATGRMQRADWRKARPGSRLSVAKETELRYQARNGRLWNLFPPGFSQSFGPLSPCGNSFLNFSLKKVLKRRKLKKEQRNNVNFPSILKREYGP